MTPRENIHLLGNVASKDCVRIDISDLNKNGKSGTFDDGYYQYYEARPLWIKIRLCLFWLFWGAFVAVIVIFILIHWCIVPALCANNVEYSI